MVENRLLPGCDKPTRSAVLTACLATTKKCGAGNDFIAKFVVAQVGSYADHFRVDGCGGTSGPPMQGIHLA